MHMSLQFKEVTESDLQVLFEMGLKCNVNQVRANAVSIISTIGTSLAKQSPPHPLLQVSKLLSCLGIFVMICSLHAIFRIVELFLAWFDRFPITSKSLKAKPEYVLLKTIFF